MEMGVRQRQIFVVVENIIFYRFYSKTSLT